MFLNSIMVPLAVTVLYKLLLLDFTETLNFIQLGGCLLSTYNYRECTYWGTPHAVFYVLSIDCIKERVRNWGINNPPFLPFSTLPLVSCCCTLKWRIPSKNMEDNMSFYVTVCQPLDKRLMVMLGNLSWIYCNKWSAGVHIQSRCEPAACD